MSEFVSKAEFGALHGVGDTAVHNWRKRGILTADAFTADGRVVLAVAERQLGDNLNFSRSAGKKANLALMRRSNPRGARAVPSVESGAVDLSTLLPKLREVADELQLMAAQWGIADLVPAFDARDAALTISRSWGQFRERLNASLAPPKETLWALPSEVEDHFRLMIDEVLLALRDWTIDTLAKELAVSRAAMITLWRKFYSAIEARYVPAGEVAEREASPPWRVGKIIAPTLIQPAPLDASAAPEAPIPFFEIPPGGTQIGLTLVNFWIDSDIPCDHDGQEHAVGLVHAHENQSRAA